jgi:hypothetical protein
MLKVIRRPYTACAYRWALSTSGISVGEGDCSDEQCDELNGDFDLDFSACLSKSGRLVWAGDCESGSGVDDSAVCGKYRLDVAGVSGFPCASTYNGSFVMKSYQPDATCGFCVYIAPKKSSSDDILNLSSCECDPDSSPTFERPASGIYNIGGAWHFFDDFALSCLVTDPLNLYPHTIPGGQYPVYERSGALSSAVGSVVTFTLNTAIPASCGSWPSTITATRISSAGVTTGPETNDRIRSKWELSYDIEATLWTLRSFNRIDYPIYTLSDSSPCDGYTKTLLLADRGDAADGCGVAPAEVTITRVCPPDRVGKSALLEDRKPNGATGKRKRQCGCDCLDEVDDRRQCATKCTSTEDEGCGNINPAPDDITCRYPEAINCCATTAGKDVPCAYTVEFECDLFFDIEDVRHKIAAKQVVLRRECYFEDPCLFVAAGPESSTGGSPVMDTDGFPGAQPVCSSCADPCLTGCTWSAWSVAACPSSDCRDNLGCGEELADFTAYVGEITNPLDNSVVAAAQTVTLLQSASWESDSATINVQMTDGSALIPCIMVLGLNVSYDGVSAKQPWAGYLADESARPCSNIYTFRLVSTLGIITASHVPATIIVTRV